MKGGKTLCQAENAMLVVRNKIYMEERYAPTDISYAKDVIMAPITQMALTDALYVTNL